MRFSRQNLNETNGQVSGSMLWRGRAWWYARHETHLEWYLGKYARSFAAYISFGDDESNSGIRLHICIPFLFSIFLYVAGVVRRCKQGHKTGIAIHNQSFWLYVFTNEDDTSRSDPWWTRSLCWNFPWSYDWHSTELLEHKANLPGLAKTVHLETAVSRKLGKDSFAAMRESDAIKPSVTETYDYAYTRKNGDVQRVLAKTYVSRMTHRMRWWPLLPFKRVSTSIWVDFVDSEGKVAELGEGTGSWKGGCTGCGYDLLHGESPLGCLRRMEKERKFKR